MVHWLQSSPNNPNLRRSPGLELEDPADDLQSAPAPRGPGLPEGDAGLLPPALIEELEECIDNQPIPFMVDFEPLLRSAGDPGQDLGFPEPRQADEIRQVARAWLEQHLRERFQEMSNARLPLDARPGFELAEAVATGDFSLLSTEHLTALLELLRAYEELQDDGGPIPGEQKAAAAPRGPC